MPTVAVCPVRTPAELRLRRCTVASGRLLAATSLIAVASGIVNIWQNDAAAVAAAYHRVTADHPGRFLIGVANPIADRGGRVDADLDTLLIAL
jgi:alkanesulfonate monooxygenase SsuD/methylene tetrahydromethanopterin reductase-like flavin-dependent oxidoreductase (luciferase family)